MAKLDTCPRQHVREMKQINRRINQALSASAAAIGANLLIHDVPGNMPLKNDEKLSSLFCKTAEEIFGEAASVRPWNCGTSDLGDISCLMPTIHPLFLRRHRPRRTARTITSWILSAQASIRQRCSRP
ncbi:MAG: hypothetical protein ACLU3I_17105 [Acutalibacteraceae bacterium]